MEEIKIAYFNIINCFLLSKFVLDLFFKVKSDIKKELYNLKKKKPLE